MALEPEVVKQFQQLGWTVASALFNAREVAAMQVVIEKFKSIGLLRNVATDGDGESHSEKAINLQLCPMYAHSELFQALPFEPKVSEAVEGRAGSALFFCYGTPHCTGDNQSNSERAGVAYHFLQVEEAANTARGDPVEDDRDYRPYLTGPRAWGGVNEYGIRVARTWETQIERCLTGVKPTY